MEKKIKSNILENNSDRVWNDAIESVPEINEQVVVRITNPNYILNETDDEITFVEIMAIGKYLPGINGESGKWVVCGPFPLYDYSPLTNKEELKEGALVSHWSVATEKEISDWANRYNVIGKYEKLSIEVDKDHEEILYRALMWASLFIGNAINDYEDGVDTEDISDIIAMRDILYDLQYCMDIGKPLSNKKDEE